MAPSRTSTMKSKHASGGKSAGGKSADGKPGGKPASGGVSKSKKPKGPVVSQQLKEKNRALLMKKPKKKTYTAEELGVPTLNMITPVGVTKPKGKKKGKVFVDDKESMNTIMSIVQAEKDGQIESKMIKARQMEEIREARQAEAEKKDQERQAKLEDVKQSLRKKRKRKGELDDDDNVKSMSSIGTKSKKKVAFA